MHLRVIHWTAAGLFIATAFVTLHSYGHAASASREVQYPAEDTTALLAARKQRQMKTVDQFKVFYQFQFSDKLKESGISFVNHVVDDAAKDYHLAHYDHGNGIAVADVDGDGLYDIYFVSQTGGNELWKNLGGGKFKNITAEAGWAFPDASACRLPLRISTTMAIRICLSQPCAAAICCLKTTATATFRDITKESGIDVVAHSSGAMFFDYDHDGLLDLLVCNVGKYTSDQKGPARRVHCAFGRVFRAHVSRALRISRVVQEPGTQ